MSVFHTTQTGYTLRVRITRPVNARDFEGFDVSRFRVGHAYDVRPVLAELLIVGGYALQERREVQSMAADRPRRRKDDKP